MTSDLTSTQESPAIPSHTLPTRSQEPPHPREGRSYRPGCDTDITVAMRCCRCLSPIVAAPNHRGPVRCRKCTDELHGSDVALAHVLTLGATLWLPPLIRLMRRVVARD